MISQTLRKTLPNQNMLIWKKLKKKKERKGQTEQASDMCLVAPIPCTSHRKGATRQRCKNVRTCEQYSLKMFPSSGKILAKFYAVLSQK